MPDRAAAEGASEKHPLMAAVETISRSANCPGYSAPNAWRDGRDFMREIAPHACVGLRSWRRPGPAPPGDQARVRR